MNKKPSPEWKTYAELERKDLDMARFVHIGYNHVADLTACMFFPVTDGIAMATFSLDEYFIELYHNVPLPKQRIGRLSMTTRVKKHSEIHSTLESMRQVLM